MISAHGLVSAALQYKGPQTFVALGILLIVVFGVYTLARLTRRRK